MSVVYVTVTVIQKMYPPHIGVFRTREEAVRFSAEPDRIYPIDDVCDVLLEGSSRKWFDDRTYYHDRLLEIVRRGSASDVSLS